MMSVHWQIETYETLESTQETLRERLKQNPPEGLVVQAITQTRGRGRQGRLWFSPPGNLYLSVLLKPQGDLTALGQLSLVTSLSVCKALEEIYGKDHGFLLKWPNDILLQGKKCSGILLETEKDEPTGEKILIVGIGINIAAAPPEIGIALDPATGIMTPLADLRDSVLKNLGELYSIWQKQGFAALRGEWLSRSFAPQTSLKVGSGKTSKSGMFQEIDAQGSLILKDSRGQNLAISSGEVFFM